MDAIRERGVGEMNRNAPWANITDCNAAAKRKMHNRDSWQYWAYNAIMLGKSPFAEASWKYAERLRND
jgi:hypothetical protein